MYPSPGLAVGQQGLEAVSTGIGEAKEGSGQVEAPWEARFLYKQI